MAPLRGDLVLKLDTLKIVNYRSLFADTRGREFQLHLAPGMNTIVGPNNCGKSNVLRALAVALDPDFPFHRSRDMSAAMTWSRPRMTLTFSLSPRSSPERTLQKYLDEYERKCTPGLKRPTLAEEGIVRLHVAIDVDEDTPAGVRQATFLTRSGKSLDPDHELTRRAVVQFHRCFHFVLVESGQSIESLLEGRFREILHTVLRSHLSEEFEEA